VIPALWPLSQATLWGLAAAVPAVLAEYLYRTLPGLPGTWHHYLYLWVPLQMAIGYSICRLVSIPNTLLMDAFIVWAFSTTFMRVAISVLVLRDQVKGGTWFALGLLLMARVAQNFWGR
jgi:hypothetical protein